MKPATAGEEIIGRLSLGNRASAISWACMPSPLGLLYAGVSGSGLCAIEFGYNSPVSARQLNRNIPVQSQSLLDDVMRQLSDYFRSERKTFTLQVDIASLTEFQQLVLKTITRIESGEVWTYRQVAEAIGKPKASRAVGQALGCNPVPIIIPCHRVVGSGGRLGGYSGGSGLQAKLWLLRHEGALL